MLSIEVSWKTGKNAEARHANARDGDSAKSHETREIRTPWNNLAISLSPCPNVTDRYQPPFQIEKERWVDFIAINLQYDRRATHARASRRTLRLCFSTSGAEERERERSYLVTSRLFPRLERPFTNSHDFTEPIVRSDDSEAYCGCCASDILFAYQTYPSLSPFEASLWRPRWWCWTSGSNPEAIRLNSDLQTLISPYGWTTSFAPLPCESRLQVELELILSTLFVELRNLWQ